MIVSIYNKVSGFIDRTIDAPDNQIAIQVKDEEDFIEGGYESELYYVDVKAKKVKKRADFTIDTIPVPCTVTIEGVDYECTEQPTIEFDAPGTYTIRVDAGPAYLEKEFEIDYQP